jgi:hypothetical protein
LRFDALTAIRYLPMATSTTQTARSPSATLALTIDLDALGTGWRQPPDRPDVDVTEVPGVAAVLGALNTLAAVSPTALKLGIPVIELVGLAAAAHWSQPDDIDDSRWATEDVTWSAWRMWGPSLTGRTIDELRGSPTARLPFVIGPGGRPDPPPLVVEMRLGSPLLIVLSVPWKWFVGGTGAGTVFLKAVEYWLASPGRVRAERARLEAKEAGFRADWAEAEAREKAALRDANGLRRADRPALLDGHLDLEE